MFHRSYGQLRHNWIFQTASCLRVLYLHRSLDPWNFVVISFVNPFHHRVSSSILCVPGSNLARIPAPRAHVSSNVIEALYIESDQYVPWSHPAHKVRCYSREQLEMTTCSAELPTVSSFCGVHCDSPVDDGDANYDGAIFWQGIFSLLGRGRKTRPDMNRDALVRIYS